MGGMASRAWIGLALLAGGSCLAWHVPGHQRVTRAAMLSLPPELQERWKAIAPEIIDKHSLLPDAYRGRDVDREEHRIYCMKPDGKAIHNVQWKREEDIASLTHTLEHLIRAIRAQDMAAAARHAGVLSHFLGDSTCPAHAFMPADSPLTNVTDMLPPPEHKKPMNLHTEIERSTPEFDLGGRRPSLAGTNVPDAAENLLDRCYAAIKANRSHTIELVKAMYVSDAATIDRVRTVGARAGAELLADAYYTAFVLADRGAR
jgi:hypothetical protein